MTLAEIDAVLSRHRGSKAEVAKSCDLDAVNVSQLLRGRSTSKRLREACEKKAQELLAREKAAEAAAAEAA